MGLGIERPPRGRARWTCPGRAVASSPTVSSGPRPMRSGPGAAHPNRRGGEGVAGPLGPRRSPPRRERGERPNLPFFPLFFAQDGLTHGRMTPWMNQRRPAVLSNRPGRIHGGIAFCGCAAMVCPWRLSSAVEAVQRLTQVAGDLRCLAESSPRGSNGNFRVPVSVSPRSGFDPFPLRPGARSGTSRPIKRRA